MVPHTPKYRTSILPWPGTVELGGGTIRYSGVRLTSEPPPTCGTIKEKEQSERGKQWTTIRALNVHLASLVIVWNSPREPGTFSCIKVWCNFKTSYSQPAPRLLPRNTYATKELVRSLGPIHTHTYTYAPLVLFSRLSPTPMSDVHYCNNQARERNYVRMIGHFRRCKFSRNRPKFGFQKFSWF